MNYIIMRQNKKIDLTKISEVINVSADSLWNIIQDPNIAKWSTLLDSTSVFNEEKKAEFPWGSRVSTVNAKGHHESYETLFHYDSTKREMILSSTKMPHFILGHKTLWKVIDIGPESSAIKINNHMTLKSFFAFFLSRILNKSIRKNQEGVCRDLKVYAETGEVSREKKKRMKSLQQKK